MSGKSLISFMSVAANNIPNPVVRRRIGLGEDLAELSRSGGGGHGIR
jgi:hypothetical protein